MKLLKYIQGLRKGKEAHRIEKEAMRDPFLSEALEGFDSVQDDHLKQIETLRAQIEARSRNTHRTRMIWGWSMVASVFLGIFLGSYYFLQPERISQQGLALEKDTLHQPSPQMTPAPQEDKVSQVRPIEPRKPSSTVAVEQKPAAISPTPSVVLPEETHLSVEEKETGQQEDIFVAHTEETSDIPIPSEELPIPAISGEPSKKTVSSSKHSKTIISSRDKSGGRVSGRIVDEDGDPVVGASVIVQGTHNGAITDIDGYFELTTNEGEKIQVSYIGYDTVTLPADTTRMLTIAMQEDSQTLSEVIVIGYGNTMKRSMAGSSSRIKKKRIPTPRPVIGKREYRHYLKESIEYPSEGECAEVKGKVVVAFFVDSAGRPYNIRIHKSLCETLDQQAIRLIEEGSDWTWGEKEVKMKVRFRPPAKEE